jgi:hypothetical protein
MKSMRVLGKRWQVGAVRLKWQNITKKSVILGSFYFKQ